MAEYIEGTTPKSEMTAMHEAFVSATAAIWSGPDPKESWDAATALIELARRLLGEAGDFRGYLATYLQDAHGLSGKDLAKLAGVSEQRMSQILKDARKRGNPVSDATTRPLQPPLVLAIVTSELGVVIAERRDKIPPWTFPGGDAQYGESPDAAAKRRVLAETGLTVTETELIGHRVHPKTSRWTIYVHAKVDGRSVTNGDPEDLAEVRWGSVDETRDKMPDMFPPVRQYLDSLLEAGWGRTQAQRM